YLRAAALNGRGQAQEAQAAIDKAFASGKADVDWQVLRGDILTKLNRFNDAEAAYREVLTRNAKHPAALLGLADVMQRSNRSDEARRVLDPAKADNPTTPPGRIAPSGVYFAKGQFDEAIKEVESLPRETWTPRVALVAGRLYVQARQYDKAVSTLGTLRQILPDVVAVRYWLGYALLGV